MLVQKIREFVTRTQMMERGDHILVACSGGADSVCLLLILQEMKKELAITLEVVHVEHGIRGEESVRDAKFVEQLCAENRIPHTCYSLDVPKEAKKAHIGLEEAARKLRYQAFEEHVKRVRQKGEMSQNIRIALAHHMEDHVETILFQMARGSGLQGLCGIRPQRESDGVCYIRPLLEATRQDIETYLLEKGQKFCCDATNLDVVYSRNRIRHRILPELTAVNEQAVRHIYQTSQKIAVVADYMNEQVQQAFNSIMEIHEDKLYLDVPRMKVLHPAIRTEVVREAICMAAGSRKDVTSEHIQSILDLSDKQSGKKVMLPYGVWAVIEYERICLGHNHPRAMQEPQESIQITHSQLEEWKENGQRNELPLAAFGGKLYFHIWKKEHNLEEIPKKSYTKLFDYDMIKNGFLIRTRMEGDYLVQDREGHHKKLKKYFIDEKIPASSRGQILLLANGSEIIWAIGERISENYKITKDTEHVVEVTYEKGDIDGR